MSLARGFSSARRGTSGYSRNTGGAAGNACAGADAGAAAAAHALGRQSRGRYWMRLCVCDCGSGCSWRYFVAAQPGGRQAAWVSS
jgi:hypothetical protein